MSKKLLLTMFIITGFAVIFISRVTEPAEKIESTENKAGVLWEHIPAGPPGKISVSIVDKKAIVQWKGTKVGISYYLVYRKCEKQDWEKIGKVKSTGDNSGLYDFSTKHKEGCEYTISVVDVYGEEGQKTVEIQN